jgi:BMFP domain-containing protein YqiC
MNDARLEAPDEQMAALRSENAGLQQRIAELEHRIALHEVAARIVHVTMRQDERERL